MQRYYVTVKTSNGTVLINRLMCDCKTQEAAIRAAKSAVVDITQFDTPKTIAPFLRSLAFNIEVA